MKNTVFIFVGKIIRYTIGCLLMVIICVFLFLFATEWLWPEFNGSYSLGSGIYMMEWDNGGRIIVKGSTIRGNTCYGGSVIIPFNKNRNDVNGNFAEYIVDANADDNWIIVKSNNHSTHQKRYYIIEKNEEIEQLHQEDIIAKYIVSFSDSVEFANECCKKGIGISW